MGQRFSASFVVRWGDVDANGHMANTAYLDVAVDCRMLFFASRGFPADKFAELRFGPAVLHDEIDYRRELRLLEPFEVVVALAGLSADGHRWRVRNVFRKLDGNVAARVTSTGVWFDLDARKPRPAPPGVSAALDALERTDDYVVLDRRMLRP